ncbi:midkine b [Menidia menidia]
MRSLSSVLLLLLLLGAEAGRRAKTPKGGNPERSQPASDCPPAETRYGKCVPEQGDCGDGLREATCRGTSTQIHCRVPCNWKKDISDCKYKFERWSPCDGATNTKTRSGKLKRALFNAECQTSVKVSKPCSHKAKKPRGEKKSN